MQKIADLTAQRRGLLDQVTSMSRPGAELRVVLGQDRFDQAEAVDRAAMDGREIGVIGLPVGVCRLAKLLGRERMDDADLEARGRECAFGRVMEFPGALDDNDDVFDLTDVDLSPDRLDGLLEALGVVLELSGIDEDRAVEIGHHPLGPALRGVDGDDGEVFRSDLLNAGMNHAVGLVDQRRVRASATPGRLVRCHGERPPGMSGSRPYDPRPLSSWKSRNDWELRANPPNRRNPPAPRPPWTPPEFRVSSPSEPIYEPDPDIPNGMRARPIRPDRPGGESGRRSGPNGRPTPAGSGPSRRGASPCSGSLDRRLSAALCLSFPS